MELLLSRETRLVLGQKMYQSMNFLRMGAEELEGCLDELSQENPILEKDDSAPELSGRFETYNYSGVSSYASRSDGAATVPEKKGSSLKQSVVEQLSENIISSDINKILRFLIMNLDSKGYLGTEIRASAAGIFGKEKTAEAIKILNSLEPAGIGAENLSDCLCIQLRARGLENSAAYKICRDYLEHFARSHYNHISRALGISEQEIKCAGELIRSLNPVPANGFDDGGQSVPAIPEIQVSIIDGSPVVTLIDRLAYRYSLNQTYCSMADDGDLSEEDRQYFKEKISQAQWVMSCVRHRSDTLLRCAEAIVEAQPDFFLDNSPLCPLSMTDVADAMGVHPSTVSRTVKDKYLVCKWGTFPISFFFAYEVNGDTEDDIIRAMRELIASENPHHPLSDQAIADALSDFGFNIARRTVAKYRDKASIPPATGRKRR